jgi:hypothetical protein
MQISSFIISADKTQLNLTITDAASLVSLRLWTQLTYKDFSQTIDLSSKITGSATENITITLSDISQNYFDGVYFLEAEDDTESSLEYVYELSKYKECILDKMLEVSACNDCLKEINTDLINAASIYKGLEYALQFRFIDEILNFINILNKFCSNECQTCGKYSNVIDITSQDTLNPDNINITVDGGTT